MANSRFVVEGSFEEHAPIIYQLLLRIKRNIFNDIGDIVKNGNCLFTPGKENIQYQNESLHLVVSQQNNGMFCVYMYKPNTPNKMVYSENISWEMLFRTIEKFSVHAHGLPA
jgi:hypothetical protein